MNKKFFMPALIAAIFAASIPALAQDRGQYNGERRDGNWQQQHTQDGSRGDDSRRDDYRRGDGQRDDRRGDYRRDDNRRDDNRRDYDRGDYNRGDYQARSDDRRYRGAGPNLGRLSTRRSRAGDEPMLSVPGACVWIPACAGTTGRRLAGAEQENAAESAAFFRGDWRSGVLLDELADLRADRLAPAAA